MKLLRLKITDPKGFRSLQSGFEHHFRTEWDLQEEKNFEPFVCAGPNGSGKSNLLEVLAAIFYHLECIYLENLPDSFRYDEESNQKGFQGVVSTPDAFELTYRFKRTDLYFTKQPVAVADANSAITISYGTGSKIQSFEIHIYKEIGKNPVFTQINLETGEKKNLDDRKEIREVLPEYILGYSSGENEILSLPFFKIRFVQFDEYWQALKQQLDYPGRPESRLVYLDSGFSQAILLCNLLFQDERSLKPFQDDVKIKELKEFRIIIRRSIEIDQSQLASFDNSGKLDNFDVDAIIDSHPALFESDEEGPRRFYCNIAKLLDGSNTTDKIISRLSRCATCWYLDEASDTLYLDYLVNYDTRQAFRDNFSNDPLELFQAFQVLLTLNLFSASESLKKDLYQSGSLYVGETVPILASDERIMRFKNFWVTKADANEPVLLKSFSDGEHQLLHTLGLCLLFKNTQSLFLLDEPETHFNPDWRANLVTRLTQCFDGSDDHEMLITTHTPFLISDSKPEKVLVFNKSNGVVSVRHPEYNTLGASINKITMATFDKRETIGLRAQTMLEDLRRRFEQGEEKEQLIAEINRQLGDSVEKVLLIKTILDSMEAQR